MLRAAPFIACLVYLTSGCVDRGGQAELGPQAAIRFAARIRQLPVLRPIRGGWLDADELATRLEKLVTPADRAAMDAFGEAMGDLGVPSGATPLSQQMVAAMATQIAGYYDPKEKVLFAIRRKASFPLEQTSVLIHEGVHALQDQHGLMASFGESVPGLDDLDAAQQAGIEGDATLAMVLGTTLYQGSDESAARTAMATTSFILGGVVKAFVDREHVAPVVGELLAFPYIAGYAYLLYGPLHDGGWPGVDAALKTPVPSTELVLHVERLAQDDYPKLIAFDPGPLPGLVEAPTTVLGERWHRFVFHQRGQPMRAAEGWGGDRVRHYRAADGRTLSVLASTWDSDADAAEAEAAWRAIAAAHDVTSALYIVRDGLRVVVVGGTAPAEREHVAAAVLASWREQRSSTTATRPVRSCRHHHPDPSTSPSPSTSTSHERATSPRATSHEPEPEHEHEPERRGFLRGAHLLASPADAARQSGRGHPLERGAHDAGSPRDLRPW
ncbi:MAG: hypothetical protein U1F43_25240 [Myxococcota bacterium]